MNRIVRRFSRHVVVGVAVAACALAYSVPRVALAQAPRIYAWYGELVAVDQKAKSITVKADVQPPVLQYINDFKSGDKVLVVWSVDRGDAINVLWVPRADAMKIGTGFVVPAEVVSADAAAKTLTFRTTVPDKALPGAAAVAPGKWIKVAATTDLTSDATAISAISATEKPQPKPKPVEPPAAPAAPAGGRGGRGGRGAGAPGAGAAAVPGAPGLPGAWAIEASLGGNTIATQCTFSVDGAKLSGNCSNQLGMSEVTGEVNGANVKFEFAMEIMGMVLKFEHVGTLDAAGKALKGDVTVFGMMTAFTGTKQ